MMNRTATALGLLALTAGTSLATATPAQAADRDGTCQSGEFCYNYNSDLEGSWSDFRSSVGNYGTSQPECYEFKGGGAGKGKCIKNDAGGFWNRSGKKVTIYYNSGHAGKSVTVNPGAKGKLPSAVYNNNASHKIGGGSTPSGGWASPVPSSAVITARVNYPSGGYHGAVDYSGFNGKFTSACTGTVDEVNIDPTYANRNAYGVSGSTNYLWVNCGGGIRMGYAHFYEKDRPAALKKGATVKAGQDLIAVGNQGNSSGQHLHFEVRRNGSKIDGHDFLQSKGVKGLPNE
ncbi:peptidoglycan DD-metalloendopeptidase family protein [Janibacter sp. GS2]|uniref:peptidoglycan DD-metalloendopeptidase family protein n=1 Tax=Janibacter sp. GS2 TaxID=3442646 RepID=UPI003EB87F86